MKMRERSERMVRRAQQTLCQAVEQLDGETLVEDCWTRPGGGGGVSRVLQNGQVFEKAGVNVSVVDGTLPPEAAAPMGLSGTALVDPRFFATGISTVLHPHNPMAPTAHANYRYFEIGAPGQVESWWFGGGADLTPSYLFEGDAVHFHRVHKEVCDQFDTEFYPRFKRWCDDYFRIPHRGESRGVGGIFFDHLDDRPADQLLAFCAACAEAFVAAYLPLVDAHKDDAFTEANRCWQQLRRGRYVEFNLLYDRGTSFGLRTGGRVESILMSLPLVARWEYSHLVVPGSPEAKLVEVLHNPREWVTG